MRIVLLVLCSIHAWSQTPASDASQDAGSKFNVGSYVRSVLASAPDVQEAQETYESARLQWLAQIGDAVLPTLSFTGTDFPYGYNPANSYVFNTLRLNNNDITYSAAANWVLFNSFKDFESVRAAALAKDSAQYALRAVQQNRAFTAIQTFYDLALRSQILDETRQNLAAEQDQYNVSQDLYQHGLKSLADLLKSETDLRSAELRVASAEADEENSRLRFNVLVDRPLDAPAELKTELDPGTTALPVLAGDLGLALRQRPEILKDQADLDHSAAALVQSVQNNLLPTLSLVATWNNQNVPTFGSPTPTLVSVPYSNYYLGLNLSIPVNFNLFSQVETVRAAKSDERRISAVLKDEVRHVRQDVYSAYISLKEAYTAYRVAAQKEDISDQNLKLVLEEYRQDSADAIRLAEAQQDFLDAQTQRSQALHDAFINRAQYRLAIGESLWN